MKAYTLNYHHITEDFKNIWFLDLWSAGFDRCGTSRCQSDVICCQITSWRLFFMKISGFVFKVNIYLLWNFQVNCMFQNEIMAPRLTDGQSDRYLNDVTRRDVRFWYKLRKTFFIWKCESFKLIPPSKVNLSLFLFLYRLWNMPKSCAPAEETAPTIFKV